MTFALPFGALARRELISQLRLVRSNVAFIGAVTYLLICWSIQIFARHRIRER
ncbi:MAG: hypothetical protein HY706_01170 [Candidatus Hydrogenedentes bacterium]|nr:hypothetical protein [Candidatus Hydrogenedentota bacterium]